MSNESIRVGGITRFWARGAFLAVFAVLALVLSGCGGDSFDIKGTWKSVGESGWGQAQPGAIVQFGDGQANLYSPADRYAFYKDGDDYRLDVTGLIGGNFSFVVKVVDKNKIELYQGSGGEPVVVLTRVS
ncbi:MAG: hypothetical protein IRY85_19915 [Micromonosporaceae bacterium]|nr:hypothetical protein [Micromonosporaceae bacterium]